MKLTPRITLVCGDKGQYRTENAAYTADSGKWIPRRVRYRVGLRLSGNKTTQVKVMMVDSDPHVPQIPADLRPLNADSSPTFVVYPKDRITDFVEIVSYPFTNEETGEPTEIQVAVQRGSLLIARGRYEFTLLVQATDVPSCEQRFVVEVDECDELQFYAKQ